MKKRIASIKIANSNSGSRKWTREDIPEEAIRLLSTRMGCVFKNHFARRRIPDPQYSNLSDDEYIAAQLIYLKENRSLELYTEESLEKMLRRMLIKRYPVRPAARRKWWSERAFLGC